MYSMTRHRTTNSMQTNFKDTYGVIIIRSRTWVKSHKSLSRRLCPPNMAAGSVAKSISVQSDFYDMIIARSHDFVETGTKLFRQR